MTLNEYKERQALYKRFSEVIKEILNSAISHATKNGTYKYNLQQIQYRAKSYESLKARLVELGEEDASNVEEVKKDLAGCRIIFYYNDDINTLRQSGRLCCKNLARKWNHVMMFVTKLSIKVSGAMNDFKWRHFQGAMILQCVRWYCKYGISYRDLEEMMLERGVDVDHTTL